MTAGLGLKVGSTTSIAVSTVSAGESHPESGNYVSLVNRTALDVEPGREPALASGSGSLTGYASRVGDPVALVSDDGRSFTGDDLYATTLACLASAASRDNATIMVAYPTHWQRYTVDALRDAVADHGLDAAYVPEAVASVAWLQRTRGADGDGVVLVYDLGGTALDIALVRTGAGSALLGRSTRTEDVSGSHFDHAVLQHVLDSTGADLTSLDPFDPATMDALAVLRDRCSAAKEVLSTDTETVVSVQIPGIDTDVRLVRSELEDMLREPLTSSLDTVREALRQNGVDASDITRVLLTGGGSSIPLVAEMISSMLRVPVTAHDDPALTSAAGAAFLAGEIRSAVAEAETVAVPVVATPRVLTPPPVQRSPAKAPTSRGRRIAIVAGAAVAIALLAAGGLGVGTVLTSDDSSTSDGAVATTTSAPTSASVAPVANAPTSATEAPAVDGAAPAAATEANTVGTAQTPATQGGQTQAAQTQAAQTQSAATPPAGTANTGTAPVAGTPNTGSPNTGGGQNFPTLPSVSNPIPDVINGTGDALGGIVGGVTNLPGQIFQGVN